MQVEEIIKEITNIARELNISAYLFGSFAKGMAHKTSDIDIAVECDSLKFDEFEAEIEKIETLRKIDLVNINSVCNEKLLEDIKKYGKVLFEKI